MRIILFIIGFVGVSAVGQIRLSELNYRSKIENSQLYFPDQQQIHSAIWPILITDTTSSYIQNITSAKNPFSRIHIYPIANVMGGYSSQTNLMYNAGLGLAVDWSKERTFLTIKYMPGWYGGGYVGDSIQNVNNAQPGMFRTNSIGSNDQLEVVGAFKWNKFFTMIGGYGRNFFGEGYRSMFLSDNAAANPFLKFETSFGSIKYVNLYQIWYDNIDPNNTLLNDTYKFSASHYISWNITREINVGVFETVVWQQKDTIANRGFDLNYLNPFVFYRPVEYGIGSADNVLLGLSLNAKVNKHHTIYSQFVLDEFLLSAIQDKSGWWGNKFGLNFGYKSNYFFLENLYFQLEFNAVRPFTYSHKYSSQNYGHLNASVTHPLGANFFELLNITSYKKGKLRITNKLVVNSYGVNADSVNVGQNIFESYSDRDGDFDHHIGQGLRKTVWNESFILEYPLMPKRGLYLNFTYNLRYEWQRNFYLTEHALLVGVKSRLWNNYYDY